MRLIPLALVLAPLALAACTPAEEPAAAPTEAVTPAEPVTSAASAATTASETDPALVAKITEILGDAASDTRWVSVVDGEGDSRLALVYLVGMNWCGSGGCNLLILRPAAGDWERAGAFFNSIWVNQGTMVRAQRVEKVTVSGTLAAIGAI